MEEMTRLANKFQKENRGRGQVTKVESYCFWWETLPDLKHPEKPTKTTIYMKSYFLEL